jgi:hypothetical protein
LPLEDWPETPKAGNPNRVTGLANE